MLFATNAQVDVTKLYNIFPWQRFIPASTHGIQTQFGCLEATIYTLHDLVYCIIRDRTFYFMHVPNLTSVR